MSNEIPGPARRLLLEPNLGWISTLMPDGAPQTTAVWVDLDGDNPIVNTLDGRQKLRNVRRDPRVSLGVADRTDPYVSLAIRGRVVEVSEQGAADHLDRLAQRYLDEERYPFSSPGDVRVLLRIEPERVHYFDPAGDQPAEGQ